jgi:hypothetical protein
MPLDMQFVFTAKPEVIPIVGILATPLKDRWFPNIDASETVQLLGTITERSKSGCCSKRLWFMFPHWPRFIKNKSV